MTNPKHLISVFERWKDKVRLCEIGKTIFVFLKKLNLIPGRIQGHADGFGFLIPDQGGDDIFLSSREMMQVLHNDRVMVQTIGQDRKGRPEGKVIEILERKNETLVGRVVQGQGVTIVAAEDKRINQDFLIPYHLDMGAKPGQIVVIEITAQPSFKSRPMGKVIQILGNYADSGMEIEIALRKHQLPYNFSEETVRIAESFSKKVSENDFKGRVDLRDLPLITIDGETARDFDDAVYAESIDKNWRLVVAIADVSFYVQPDNALDKEAFDRGNSVYFPRRVIPMLPEALSNGLCSLNPHVDRLCMICDMLIDQHGKVLSYKFYPSVMESKARMTYTDVSALLKETSPELTEKYKSIIPQIKNLESVYRILTKQRHIRGAIEFDSSETIMIFNDQGKIDRIEPVIRNEAHRLIEECMLAANVCAANFLIEQEHPALYRIHEGPTEERLENLQIFLAEFGFMLTGGDKPSIKDYAALIEKIKGRPDEHLLQTVLLRSMQQAVYSPDNIGHFGLAYDAYAHFTSPIRRYPDLLIHRAIKATLENKKMPASNWHVLGQHCSMTERRADDATRDVSAWLKCYYMQDKIGEVYEGTVAGVTSFGLFVSIDDIYIEGLLHVTELGNDYFTYDKARHAMVGERSHVVYRLGDRLKVKLVRVDLELSKIDFSLESHQEVQKSPLKDRKPKNFFKEKVAHKKKAHPGKHKSGSKVSGSTRSKKKIRAK
jgi:ribonuclease R